MLTLTVHCCVLQPEPPCTIKCVASKHLIPPDVGAQEVPMQQMCRYQSPLLDVSTPRVLTDSYPYIYLVPYILASHLLCMPKLAMSEFSASNMSCVMPGSPRRLENPASPPGCTCCHHTSIVVLQHLAAMLDQLHC
jgi:hypothetical protein